MFHDPWISIPVCLHGGPCYTLCKTIATHWSIREVDRGATTVVTAEFCLVAPCVKTGLNVTSNGACQQLNTEQRSTTQAIVLI